MSTRKLTVISMLSALSVVLVALIRFSLFPAAPFLEYDPADVPILVASFIFGVPAGLIITVVTSLIQGLTVSAQSGIYGIVMHIISTASLIATAGLIYNKKGGLWRLIIACFCGCAAMTVVMVFANLLITPFFMNCSIADVKAMIWVVIAPFNLIKSGINSIIAIILFKSCGNILADICK